jgi:glycosyltransferase involved in cell wall biosynthesis
VVDGILDDTLAVAAAYADRLPLRLFVSDEPRGTCHALNTGYAAAVGRVLIRCDDDLTPGPSMVERHVAWHPRGALRGVVGPTRDVFPNTPYARVYGRDANERSLERAYRRSPEELWINWAAHNSVTREGWDLVGGFDDRFVYGQDSELGWRLHRAGVDLYVDMALEIAHRGPTTSAAVRVPRAFVSGCSRQLFCLVHPEARHPVEQPIGLLDRVWSAGTALLARAVRGRAGYRRIGGFIDRILPFVPVRIGSRLVAFGVESAGRSGFDHGPTDLTTFKDQKVIEVGSELTAGR